MKIIYRLTLVFILTQTSLLLYSKSIDDDSLKKQNEWL